MRLVDRAEIRPMRCAVLPQLGHDHARGYVDTGAELNGFDNHVYISVIAIEKLAQTAGLPTPSEVTSLALELQEAREEIERLTVENTAQAEQLDAVAVLKRYGTKVERKPGRPRSKSPERKAAA